MKVGLYRFDDPTLYALLRQYDDFGIDVFDLLRPPVRFWGDGVAAPAAVQLHIDSRRPINLSSPTDLLSALPPGDTWRAMTRRSISRLHAWFLVCEDPQRRLDAQPVETLAHQASLVRHVLQEGNLQRVLIADEVGLGKTIEAGLILKELLSQTPGLRTLYLAPAKLVRNVVREFDKLSLDFRSWVAGADSDARLQDARIVASIHRAAHSANFAAILAAPPWDVIIVDECHHLSAWGPDGSKPVRKYKLVEELGARLKPSGRLILMSGTPHQGHPDRFKNLLTLLQYEGEPDSALAGRVIYRTKDDIQDWDGRPVFPQREVHAPIVLDLGPEHRAWLSDIHDFFEPSGDDLTEEGRRRAAGWRCGQALQWAASSIQAGLGFLVRQAIRARWDVSQPALREALAALRPYRGGKQDETVESLFERISREVGRQLDAGDIEDLEEFEETSSSPGWRPDSRKLANLLSKGVDLLRRDPNIKWERIFEDVLKPAGDEKVVLFAQPIETVTALSGFLEARTGRRPALIVGGQDDELRQKEIEEFWKPNGPQFLVSSRAGGEGLNLQVARRLVHVDVPWNPMELEQRVGRIHRFMSRRKILVDTIVVKESREVDTFRVAREKLRAISSALVPEERFEALFSRVMALVPPEELQAILQERPLGPLSDDEQRRLSQLIADGFARWRDFDRQFSDNQKQIRYLDPGEATWDDVKAFATEHLRAEPATGYSSLRFRWSGGEVEEASEPASVLEIEGKYLACGDYGGMPVLREDGTAATPFGLNHPLLADGLRRQAFPGDATGAAHVRWPAGRELPVPGLKKPFGVLVLVRHSVRWIDGTSVEAGTTLEARIVDEAGVETRLDRGRKGEVVRTVLACTQRQDAEPADQLIRNIQGLEARLLEDLRRPSDADRDARISHGVFPLLACVVW